MNYLGADVEPPTGIETYLLYHAARFINVAPWVLAEQSVWWRDQALIKMTVDHKVSKALEGR